MSEYGPWIGRCYFRKWLERPKNDPFIESRFKDYACFAAVWTDSQADFLDTVTRQLEAQGYAFTWAEDVLPILSWMTRYGYHAEVESLSPRVNGEHRIELGAMIRTGEDGRPLPEVDPVLITRLQVPELPDQAELPFWERTWIAPELESLLFGQPQGQETVLNTYFLVDAALRKNIVGTFDLEAVDVPVKCLFEGEGSEAQKASAPYLVDLALPQGADQDADLVPRFHKDLFARHWAQETGIVIRTAATFDATWRHCQAHLKVPVEGESRQLFLRYWHPETLDTLLPVLERGDAYQLLRDTQLIYPREGEVVHAQLNPELGLGASIEEQPFTLKEAYYNAFGQCHRERFRQALCREVKSLEAEMNCGQAQQHVDYCLEYCESVGLSQPDSIKGFVYLTALYGRDVLKRDAQAVMIADASIPEGRRKVLIHHLITRFKG
ncbi:DUF4123 domain-containing protein [Billgrantia aerodenitrificans]|uniref:DUF4123 domain-containing protein n=1 Tax=Billgrantia aerodenitrificans TaxID=2733483 RepID=A0ABS9ATV8_9GAMM|nr:DUF4123 domain-containing protein [Halomonas aerodenitrificans]MCE8025318.1 DUF4123 domain-containing protein [Halomonas aerodenitrificans]